MYRLAKAKITLIMRPTVVLTNSNEFLDLVMLYVRSCLLFRKQFLIYLIKCNSCFY